MGLGHIQRPPSEFFPGGAAGMVGQIFCQMVPVQVEQTHRRQASRPKLGPLQKSLTARFGFTVSATSGVAPPSSNEEGARAAKEVRLSHFSDAKGLPGRPVSSRDRCIQNPSGFLAIRVELDGLEPTTLALQTRCSPHFAKRILDSVH